MKHGSKCSTQLGRNRQEPDMDKEHHEYRNTGMNSILDDEAAFYTTQSHFCESIPSSIRTLVGSMPSANFGRLRAFNILQHPSTSFNILHHPFTLANTTRHQCPTPARALLHEQRVPQLVLPLLQLHCSLQHCPGNHQLRSSNDPQEENMTLKTRLQTYMLWKNKDPRGSRGPKSKMSTTSCRNSQMRKDM